MNRRRPQPKWDITKILLVAIAALALILISVICIAVGTSCQTPVEPSSPGTSSSSPSSGPSTSGSSPQTAYVGLIMTTAPADQSATVEQTVLFAGTSDPAAPLTVNGKEVPRESDGSFSYAFALAPGENQISFSHKEETYSLTVTRRHVIEYFSPSGSTEYNSGATIHFEVSARENSTVSVAINGSTITMQPSKNQLGSGVAEGFVLYTAELALPSTNTKDLDYGVATFTAVCDGVTETCTSSPIVCLKTNQILASDPGVTPSYGDYIDVGSGYIAEIVTYCAETFDGDTRDDYSHPTNIYLPKGTVDYCSTDLVEVGQLKYALLRCGRRVYIDKKNTPSSVRTKVVDRYIGKLPDHNEIAVASMQEVGNHTILTLDCLWKAPFYFDLLPQTYSNPNGGSNRSYEITAFTATYIDITFCYATKFSGTVQIPTGNTLFQSAEVIQNESDCTLRLHLKKTGGFYGWDSYYNEAGQLCFQFLNPAKVTAAENTYGVDLTGVTVMIDVGHGGVDGGATGTDAEGTRWSESGRNMDLAWALQKELESVGATVVFNREGKVTLTVDERIQILKNAAPDFCIAIHHNSISGYPDISGFESYYYGPFSKLASERILLHTKESGVYKSTGIRWHNYYVSRQTTCPVVLTENGYMSNLFDLNGTLDPATITLKAKALAQGIADYFLMSSP